MKILHVHLGESASGLASGYQRTNNTTSSTSVVETTGGDILIRVSSLPWYSLVPSDELGSAIPEGLSLEKALAEGYKEMADQNSLFAEELLPVIMETWPTWEG